MVELHINLTVLTIEISKYFDDCKKLIV